MKLTQFLIISVISILVVSSCGSKAKSSDSFDINAEKDKNGTSVKASTRVDLENKGVGPIKELTLPSEIDAELAASGKELYEEYCTLCHKPEVDFIGPAPKGVLKRRTPEWVMNMILDPGRMLRDDPLAKELFMEFNGSPMSDQGMTEAQARAILEYFRTL